MCAELNEIINITLSKFNKKYKQSFDDESIFREQYVKDLFIFYKKFKPDRKKDLKRYWYQKKNVMITCECGSKIRALGYKAHLNSDKHVDYMYNIEILKTKNLL